MTKQDDLLIKDFELVLASQLRSNASGSSFHGKFREGFATYVVNQTNQDREAVIIPVGYFKAILLKAKETDLAKKLSEKQTLAESLRENKNKERLEKMAESFSKKYGKQQYPEKRSKV